LIFDEDMDESKVTRFMVYPVHCLPLLEIS